VTLVGTISLEDVLEKYGVQDKSSRPIPDIMRP
jgi:hypothetical protein